MRSRRDDSEGSPRITSAIWEAMLSSALMTLRSAWLTVCSEASLGQASIRRQICSVVKRGSTADWVLGGFDMDVEGARDGAAGRAALSRLQSFIGPAPRRLRLLFKYAVLVPFRPEQRDADSRSHTDIKT